MVQGPGSFSVGALCFFSTLTGIGSCCAFGGALKMGQFLVRIRKPRFLIFKTAALNWPKHRGSATSMPLAAFGLSAFFFSRLSAWLFPGNTESFLLVLALATSGIIVIAVRMMVLTRPCPVQPIIFRLRCRDRGVSACADRHDAAKEK